MPKFNISEKTAALLPELIQQAGITNPIVGIDETKTLIRIYLLATPEPIIIKKPKPKASRTRAQRTRTTGSQGSQETQASAKLSRSDSQQTRGKKSAST